MNQFNLGSLKTAFASAGKTILKSSIETVATFGTISVLDPQFAGKRAGDNGDYIMLRDASGDLIIIGVAKGCPKAPNAFEIKQLTTKEDIKDKETGKVVVEANSVWFKAFGIVEEVE